MNLTFTNYDSEGNCFCHICRQITNGKRYSGVWYPTKPFEPNGKGRGYVYTLCMPCYKEVKKVQKKDGNTWLKIIEDEIQEGMTLKLKSRTVVDTTNMSEKEFFELQMLLLTGRGTNK